MFSFFSFFFFCLNGWTEGLEGIPQIAYAACCHVASNTSAFPVIYIARTESIGVPLPARKSLIGRGPVVERYLPHDNITAGSLTRPARTRPHERPSRTTLIRARPAARFGVQHICSLHTPRGTPKKAYLDPPAFARRNRTVLPGGGDRVKVDVDTDVH